MKVLLLIPPSKYSKNVARDLVYGCWCKGKRIAGIQFPPVSQLQVVTTLIQSGIDCTLLDAAGINMSFENVIQQAITYDSIIDLTSTMTINEDAELLSKIKQENSNIKTIVYGAHPTFMPRYTLAKDGIDFIVKRESEFIIRDLILSLSCHDNSYKKINGIGYIENGELIINPDYEFIHNLDDLPIPDRSLLSREIEYFNPIVKRIPFTTMFTSRGCPGKCTYCTSPPFYGTTYRARSAESVLEEIDLIVKQGYKEIFFRDEMFTTDRERVVEICEGIIKRNYDLSWIASTRVNAVSAEIMSLMKKAGCHMLRFGVESGDQEILNTIKKGIKLEHTLKDFELAHKYKIDTHAHCMIGMPGETEDSIKRTLEFIIKIDPTIVTFGVCTPYPGTQLFEEVLKVHPEVQDGSDCDLSKLHTNSFYNDVYTKMSNEELNAWIKRIYRRFYFRPSYLFRWLSRINSIDELKRVSLAAAQVVDFAFLSKE